VVIDVNEIPGEGLHLDQDFDFVSLDLVEEEAVFLQPTHAEVEIRKVGSDISDQGTE